jgi:hypothetical protein
MKVRNGFVSNSSSSSFILQFDKRVNSSTELKELVFGNKDTATMRTRGTNVEISTAKASASLFNLLRWCTTHIHDLQYDIGELCAQAFQYEGEEGFDDVDLLKENIIKRIDEYVSTTKQRYSVYPYTIEDDELMTIPEVRKLIVDTVWENED